VEEVQKRYAQKAYWYNIVTVLLGGIVFLLSELESRSMFELLLNNSFSFIAVMLAGLSLPLLWNALKKRQKIQTRILVGFQVSMILGAVAYAYFPDFLILKNGAHLSLMSHYAPEKTLQALGGALLIGSLFILPALGYLYYIFQKKETHS